MVGAGGLDGHRRSSTEGSECRSRDKVRLRAGLAGSPSPPAGSEAFSEGGEIRMGEDAVSLVDDDGRSFTVRSVLEQDSDDSESEIGSEPG